MSELGKGLAYYLAQNGILSGDQKPQGILYQNQPAQGGLLSNNPLMPPPANLPERAYQFWPKLRDLNVQFMDSRGDPNAGNRQLETYPADERDNPMPGRPTIQQFNPKATHKDFLGEALHVLPKVDPYVGQLRETFARSMTPQQQERLRQQYEYHRQNYGESRPFEQWRDVTGLDSWFRGHVSGQWPSDMYTPEQLNMFKALEGYLRR